MLQNAKELQKYALRARDGHLGSIADIYFDDEQWHVRYFVVDVGSWLDRRHVLISPEVIGDAVWDEKAEEHILEVELTKEQIRGSPGVDTDKPVSRQHEIELSDYYGWPTYWGTEHENTFPATDLPVKDVPAGAVGAQRQSRNSENAARANRGDPHLRSSAEVIKYTIAATDGEIGQVADLLIENRAWTIRYFVIDMQKWWPGRKVIMAPEWIRDVDWNQSRVVVDLDRETIRQSPEYDPAHPVTADYARQLHDYYGRPHQASWPE